MDNARRLRVIDAGRYALLTAVIAWGSLTSPAQAGDEPTQTPAPAQPEQGDDPSQTQGDQAFSQVIELASAYRQRQELDLLLTAEGLAVSGAEDADDHRLADLATRCEVLANSVQSQQARAILLDCQARAYAALAQIQTDETGQPSQRRLQQMRSAVDKLRKLDVPIAKPLADYWLLLADLADDAQSDASVASRQALAEQRIKAYLEQYQDHELVRDDVIDARLSLAQLLDQRGDQVLAKEQIDAIGPLPESSPRRPQIDRLLASASRIGMTVELEGVTTQLKLWRLSEHLGKPVLLHVYADAVEPSVAMIDQITQAIIDQSMGGSTIVSLRVGEPVTGTRTAPWPTLPIGLESGGVLEQLSIDALPTLVWIDAQGKVASIGHTAAVLDQMPKLATPNPAEPDEQPAPAQAPAKGP